MNSASPLQRYRTQIVAALQELLSRDVRVAVSATGGAAGISQLLWETPGASKILVGTRFPYLSSSLARFLGRPLLHSCDPAAAIALATTTFLEAQEAVLASHGAAHLVAVRGIGITAAVQTLRQRRGRDRVHLSYRTPETVKVAEVSFEPSLGRMLQGAWCDLLALHTVLSAAGIEPFPVEARGLRSEHLVSHASGSVLRFKEPSPPDLGDLSLPRLLSADGDVVDRMAAFIPAKSIILPGSFDPLHPGHHRMAEFAELVTGRQAYFEISVINADKGAVQPEVIARRALQFRGRWPVLIDSIPRFLEKARAFKAPFVVGADTAQRILDSRFYEAHETIEGVLAEIERHGSGFYVMQRLVQGRLLTLDDLPLPERFSHLFHPLPGRIDLSSTEIRSTT